MTEQRRQREGMATKGTKGTKESAFAEASADRRRRQREGMATESTKGTNDLAFGIWHLGLDGNGERRRLEPQRHGEHGQRQRRSEGMALASVVPLPPPACPPKHRRRRA